MKGVTAVGDIFFECKDPIARVDWYQKEPGLMVVTEIENFEYGKFIHILYGEDNRVELWEANDSEYGKIIRGV